MKRNFLLLTAATLITSAWTSGAAIVTVLPGDPTWGSYPGESSGGGSSAITTTAPRSGNGSVEMFGDRTRFVGLGDLYSPASNLGLLSDVSAFTFDWSVAVGSAGSGPGAAASYSPALRFTVWDGGVRSELIWENAYNGSVPAVQGTWYTTGVNDNFWQYVSGGVGDTHQYNNSISDWQGIYSANAYISAISVGVGGSAGSGYHAFADNVTVDFGAGPTTYNFEVPVPEPTTVIAGALLLLPFGASTLRILRKKRTA